VSPIRVLILILAAAAAVAAALLVRNMANQPAPEAAAAPVVVEKEIPMVKVLVAARDMQRGELLTAADLVWTDWPEDALNPLFYNDRDMPSAIMDLSGAAVRNEVFESEPILPQKLVEKGETGYMAALVSPGMLGVAVEVSPESASGGFILPDDRVDIIVTYTVEVPQGNGEVEEVNVSQTVLSNVRVLAIDQVYRQNEAGAYTPGSVATLELDPADSEVLMLAQGTGSLSLALRSFADARRDGKAVISKREDYLAMVSPTGPESDRPGGAIMVVRNGEARFQQAGGGN
jgi:pilus assembly protein CpaB